MFDWYKKLFGEGVMRFEVMTSDARPGVVKIKYIGDINTVDMEEVKFRIRNECLVKYGEEVVSVKYIGHT